MLVIEDEKDIVRLLKYNLEKENYQVLSAFDGEAGLALAKKEKPDLILLDVMLPKMDGMEVCRTLRQESKVPIIMLTARKEELDRILGLELGADDYVSKPFSPKVLFSRIKAILRRGKEPNKAAKAIKFSDFLLEIDHYILRKGNQMIPLTLSEFGILRRLVTNRGRVLTRNQLLDDINNDDAFIVDRNIDVHIASLRKKLGPTFDWIETVRGVGYRFRDDPSFVEKS